MWEGFPSAPCEAMLCGCVPIVSNVAALPEIAGKTGYVLSRKDLDELEELIYSALRADTNKAGELARARIMAMWPKDNRQHFLDLVKKLACGNGM